MLSAYGLMLGIWGIVACESITTLNGRYPVTMPSGTQPEPGPFARAVCAEIRLAMTRRRVSGAEVARMTGRSQSYLSKRLRDESALTANDVADICDVLGEDLEQLLVAAVRASRRP